MHDWHSIGVCKNRWMTNRTLNLLAPITLNQARISVRWKGHAAMISAGWRIRLPKINCLGQIIQACIRCHDGCPVCVHLSSSLIAFICFVQKAYDLLLRCHRDLGDIVVHISCPSCRRITPMMNRSVVLLPGMRKQPRIRTSFSIFHIY